MPLLNTTSAGAVLLTSMFVSRSRPLMHGATYRHLVKRVAVRVIPSDVIV